MKQYLLLRDNKESGPYTAGQLISMGFKPYDLIWVDGKSAAWRYPGELEEFKPHAPIVEEQPFDRFFKQKGVENADNKAINTTELQGQTTMAGDIKKEKPRIRIKAEWNKVEPSPKIAEPIYNKSASVEPAKTQTKITPVPSWQNSWLDWQQEQKAVSQASKNTEFFPATPKQPANAANANAEPVLETKFSESLSDIKERYASTILKAKTKASEWYKFKGTSAFLLLAIPVLCLGIWLGHDWTSNSNAKTVLAAKTAAVNPAETNSQQSAIQPNDQAAGKAVEEPVDQQPVKKNSHSKEVIPTFDQNDNNTQNIDPGTNSGALKQANAKKSQPNPSQSQGPEQQNSFKAPDKTDMSARNKVVNPSLVPSNNSGNKDSQEISKKKLNEEESPSFSSHFSKKEKIDDFVSVDADQSSRQSIQDLRLNVQNVADFPLDLVVIDVQYYDVYGRFKTGQTMYIKNIPANERINVKVPDNPSASKIKYRVSLVSAEQKGLYLIAD